MTTDVTEATNLQAPTPDDYIAGIEELARAATEIDNIDFRAQVPPGTPLGTVGIEPGADVNFKKPTGLVRAGNRALPERIPLYDLQSGDVSMVPPPIAMKRIMEHGARFTMRKPAGESPRQPIEDTCQYCLPARMMNGAGPRLFYSEYDLDAHKQILHPREWSTEERSREAAERREDRTMLISVMQELVTAIRSGDLRNIPAEVRPMAEQVRQEINRSPTLRTSDIVCECGWQVPEGKNPAKSMNAHKRFNCKLPKGAEE